MSTQPTEERRKEDMYRIGRIEATLESQKEHTRQLYAFIKDHMDKEEVENRRIKILIGVILLIHFFDLTWSQAVSFITKILI